jgi:hypothetical protein
MDAKAASAAAAASAAEASSAGDAWLEASLREAAFPEAHPKRARAKRDTPMIDSIDTIDTIDIFGVTGLILDI